MPKIIGEITADGRLLVMGQGAPEDQALQAAWMETLTPLVKDSAKVYGDALGGALVMPLSWPAVVQLAFTFGKDWAPQPRLSAWIAEQVRLREVATSTEPQSLAQPIPAGLTPYSWQIEGAHIVGTLGRALITDEPGTGKTITAILGIREYMARHRRSVLPALIVAPASVVIAWVRAFELWAPELPVVAWRGSRDRRRKLAGMASVYVTSYDTARTDAQTKDGPLAKLRPKALVVDECHAIKSSKARRTLAINRLAAHAELFIGMSGTPITHNSGDVWTTLVHVAPGAWPAKERWIGRYCVSLKGDYSSKVLGLNQSAEPEFRTAILGQHRRVAKQDKLELPPKIHSVRTIELPAEHRKAYDAFEQNMLAELPDGQELAVMDVLSQLGHLSLLACCANDVEVELVVDKDGEPVIDERTGEQKRSIHLHPKLPSWKVDAALEILAERPGKPTGVFGVSARLMRLAGKAAEDAGYTVGYLMGGQTPKNRQQAIDDFQAGKLDLIVATAAAGGVGVTLTAADTLIVLQRPYSIVDALQMEDRFHRIGSEIHQHIEIIDIVAWNTIESRVRAVLKDKAVALAELVQDPRIVAQLLGGTRVTPPKGVAA